MSAASSGTARTLRRVHIAGTGSFAPETRRTNADLEKLVVTNDAWITERTGIKERRVAPPEQTVSELAAEASRRAMEAARVRPEDVDLIICATSSPERVVPPTSAYVQSRLGCWNAGFSDVLAACSGFVYALSAGSAQVAIGTSRCALVLGTEVLSRILNMKDRNTCVIFGDGAGAAVLMPTDSDSDILYVKTGGDGRLEGLIIAPNYGSSQTSLGAYDPVHNTIQMKGREVYRFAVPKFVEMITEALAACRLRREDVKLLIPHQMNARMIEAVASRLEFPLERVLINIDRYGNTSSASIPIALDEAVRAERLRRGDIVVMAAMGAGLTWGTVVLKW